MSVRAPTTSDPYEVKSQECELTQVIEINEIQVIVPESAVVDDTRKFSEPKRRYPPMSIYDSFRGKDMLKHPHVDFISDKEILKIHPVFEVNCMVSVTEKGKHIVHQQAQRSCVPAALSMLFLDIGGSLLEKEIRSYNLTSSGERDRLIEVHGYASIKYYVFGNIEQQIAELKECLAVAPGLLEISSKEVGGHVVILDEITEKSATIRDPYHGWMVTVSLDTFKSWNITGFIHIGTTQP